MRHHGRSTGLPFDLADAIIKGLEILGQQEGKSGEVGIAISRIKEGLRLVDKENAVDGHPSRFSEEFKKRRQKKGKIDQQVLVELFSDHVRVHTRHRLQDIEGVNLCDDLLEDFEKIKGIEKAFILKPFELHIFKAKFFTWDELRPAIMSTLARHLN